SRATKARRTSWALPRTIELTWSCARASAWASVSVRIGTCLAGEFAIACLHYLIGLECSGYAERAKGAPRLRAAVGGGLPGQAGGRRATAAVRGRGLLLAGRTPPGTGLFGPARHDGMAGAAGDLDRRGEHPGPAHAVPADGRAGAAVRGAHRHAMVRGRCRLACRQPGGADAAERNPRRPGPAGCAAGTGHGPVPACGHAPGAPDQRAGGAGTGDRHGPGGAEPLPLRRGAAGWRGGDAVPAERPPLPCRSTWLAGGGAGHPGLGAAGAVEPGTWRRRGALPDGRPPPLGAACGGAAVPAGAGADGDAAAAGADGAGGLALRMAGARVAVA